MDQPKRYHPLLVTLHWLVAVLVGAELYIGLFLLEDERGGGGPAVLAIHMLTGIAILALIIVRFFVRVRSKKPADANVGSPALGLIARLVHYGLYVMLLVITVVGITMAVQTRRLQSVLLGQQPRFGEVGQGFRPENPQFAPNGQPGSSFQRPEGTQRPDFNRSDRLLSGPFLLRGIHKLSTYVLLLLIGVHVLATLYHLVVKRDNLMARMWYGTA